MPSSNTLERASQIPVHPLEPELHIASLVVHTRPEALSLVTYWLEQQPGVEIHAASDLGKLVVVVESDNSQTVLNLIDQATEQPGVINAALVYHELVSPEEE